MIDSNFKAAYLKPSLWTNLGRILNIINPEELILHVLLEKEEYVKAVTSKREEVDFQQFVKNGKPDFDSIFTSYETLSEIRIYTLKSLEQYYRKVQCRSMYTSDIDEFIAVAFGMLEAEEGIEIKRRHKRKSVTGLERIKQFAGSLEHCAFLVWITEENALIFNCILEFGEGKLTGLYTSDKYHEHFSDYDMVCCLMKKEYNSQFGHIKMELRDLEQLL